MPDPLDELCRKGRIDRASLPELVESLSTEEAGALTDLFANAVDRRRDELIESIDAGLVMVPRPLRRPVKKVLGV